VNLHVVVEKSLPDGKVSSRIARRQSAPSRARACTERGGGLLEIYVNDIDQSLDDSLDGTQQHHRGILENEEAMYPTNGTDREQSSRSQRDPFSASERSKQADGRSPCDAHCNPLSERVLQWLDLSGRARDYEPEEQDSKESSTTEENRRWRSVRRRRHFSQTRESSALATRERIVVQNYKLRKNYKLDCIEAKPARKRSSRKDTIEEQIRRESEIAGSKDQVAEGKNSKTEDESRKDLVAVWSSLGRLQLHIVMPSFNSVEKRSSSLESIACD